MVQDVLWCCVHILYFSNNDLLKVKYISFMRMNMKYLICPFTIFLKKNYILYYIGHALFDIYYAILFIYYDLLDILLGLNSVVFPFPS